MEITYINHSGFLIEWETCYFLFDYYKGDIPQLDRDKKLYIFVSHNHGDHFNPEIFSFRDKVKDISFILSSDVKPGKYHEENGSREGISDKILSVKPRMTYEFNDNNKDTIILQTLKSTDSGVAFLIDYQGKRIYHAGDLNLWVWKEETKEYNNNMTTMFHQEMESLKGRRIDVAFVPLDPRQEEWYSLGLESLLEVATLKYVFPMHFWDNPDIIRQFKEEKASAFVYTQIMSIKGDGQKWSLE